MNRDFVKDNLMGIFKDTELLLVNLDQGIEGGVMIPH